MIESESDKHQVPRRPLSAAGRLIERATHDDPAMLGAISRHARVPKRALIECREGIAPLELESQMRVAAAIAELAPEHARAAYRLYGHAQAALRSLLETGRTHANFPKSDFR